MNLTIFGTCKPFKGSAAIHQTNAIRSWSMVVPKCDIMLFGNEGGLYDVATRVNAKQVPDISRIDDLPLIGEMFRMAQEQTDTELLAYCNSDILIVDGLVEAALRLAERFPNFLGVCRRWDLSLSEPYEFLGDWRSDIRKRVRDEGTLHSRCSSDIFVFGKSLWELPAFVVGRPEWDNWMMWKATDVGWPVVDLTPVVTLAHPRHGYGVNAAMNVVDFWRFDPYAQRNRDISGKGKQYCFKHVAEAGHLWRMNEDEIYQVGQEGADPPTA